MTARLLRAARWTALLVALAACGRKTPPVTPASPRPEAVHEVKAVTRGSDAFLSWAVPTKNVEGKDMSPTELKGFLVLRAEVDREKKRPRYKTAAEIDLERPAPAELKNGRVFWTDHGLRYGLVYSYRVRAVSVRGGISAVSEEVRAAPLLSLASSKTLTTEGGDGSIQLTWGSVTSRTDGSTYGGFVGYNVYRGTEPGRYDDLPLNKEPVRKNGYKDTSTANNVTYYYMVRAVDSPALPWTESLDSPEASAVSRKRTPPEAPMGLTVVPGVGRIFLTWNENKERDVAGYHVYRSAKSGKDFERLTDKPVNRTTFSDETMKPGVPYYYAVTAVDQSGNESKMSKEQKATAEKAR